MATFVRFHSRRRTRLRRRPGAQRGCRRVLSDSCERSLRGEGMPCPQQKHFPCSGSEFLFPSSSRYWICGFNSQLGIWIWEPAEGLWDESSANSYFTRSAGGFTYREMTRGRVEDLWDGLNTGADVYSSRNGRGWSVPRGWLTDRSVLYKWNGSAWNQCGDSGWYSNGGTQNRFTPTFFWGAACGAAAWYGTWGYGYQWTGSAWNGGGAWSGYIYLDDFGSMAQANNKPTPPPANSSPAARPQKPSTGPPSNSRGGSYLSPGEGQVTVDVPSQSMG